MTKITTNIRTSIKRNIKTKHQTIRATAYKTLVRPQLEYASCAWDPYTRELSDKIEMVQRRAARWTVSDFSPTSSVSLILDRLGWETLEHRRSCARLSLFHGIVYGHVAVQRTPLNLIPDNLILLLIWYDFKTQNHFQYSQCKFTPLNLIEIIRNLKTSS